MGKKTGKGSRKAARKKYQRKIDVSDIIAANEAAKKEERLATVADSKLFVVDRKAENIIVPKAKRRKLARDKVTSLEAAAYYQSDYAPSPFTPTIKPKKSINEKKMNEEVQSRKRKRADSSSSSSSLATINTTTTITTTNTTTTMSRRQKIIAKEQRIRENRAKRGPKEDIWASPAPSYPISVKQVGKGQEKLKKDNSNFDSGFSYNPDKEKHQGVLAVAVADELQKVRDIDEVEDFFKVSPAVKRLSKGMDSTIPFFGPRDGDDEEEEETDDDDEDEDFPAYRPTSADPIRKTKTERNKEAKKRTAKRRMEGERKRNRKRDPRVSERVVSEAVEKVDELEAKRASKREYLAEKKEAVTTASYNKNKIPARPMPVLLTDQLPSTLRQIPEVDHFNPISEQFEKFQKKGVIEAREKKEKARKHTPKRYRKHEYKDFMDNINGEPLKIQQEQDKWHQKQGKKGKKGM